MTDHIARLERARRRNYTGTLYGGNPPDSGGAYVNGSRIAFLPIAFLKITSAQFDDLIEAHKSAGKVLSRQEARAVLLRRQSGR